MNDSDSLKKQMLVIDANVIIAALLKDSTTRKMILSNKELKLFSPEFIKQELLKYLNYFSKKLKVNEEELNKTIIEFFYAAKIEIVPSSEYSEFLQKAIEVSPDKKDAPYFALGLKLSCPIWSNDKILKNQTRIKIYSTHELIEYFQK